MVIKSDTSGGNLPYGYRWRNRLLSMAALGVVLLLVVVLASSMGSVSIQLADTWRILLDRLPFIKLDRTWSDGVQTIIWDIRLPRVLLAGIVGMALSIAGAVYQGLFRNPLADPYLIGVAQGSALGAVVGFLLPAAWLGGTYSLVPVLAFVGGLLTVMLVYGLARVGKTLPMSTLILAGVALGALLGALVNYITITSGNVMRSIVFWMSGSFSLSRWSEFWTVCPIVLAGSVVILFFGRYLNIMQLDEEQARQLGVNVEQIKLILLIIATLITAAAVSFVGIIGFVGIIIPHAVRLIWGPDYRFLLPLSMLTGAIFLILVDLLARTMLSPSEIPIGVITAVAGAPFFLYLLRRKARMLF